MSSATPMASNVRDVLLKTSAPSASSERTRLLASAPDSTTNVPTPFASSAATAEEMRSSEATLENSVGSRSNRLAIASSLTCDLRETAVHQRHRHRTLADRRRAALDRAAPDVARGEHAGEIGLQGKWLPGQGPGLAWPRAEAQIAPGHEVPGFVGDEADLSHAVSAGGAADADEERIRRKALGGPVVRHHQELAKAPVTLHADDRGAGLHIDIGEARDPVDEVLGHRFPEVVPTHE